MGEVTCGELLHLTCKRDQIKMRDYMDRRVTPPKRVTSPTWGPRTSCKQALNLLLFLTSSLPLLSGDLKVPIVHCYKNSPNRIPVFLLKSFVKRLGNRRLHEVNVTNHQRRKNIS